jgi:hypothetical protein
MEQAKLKETSVSRILNGSSRLGLVEHYAVPCEDGRLFLKSATNSGLMSGRMVGDVFPKLFPLLDGSKRFEDIAEHMSGIVNREQLSAVLDFLVRKGFVKEIEETPRHLLNGDLKRYESVMRYFSQYGSRYATVSCLREATIGIINASPIAPALASALAHLGIPRITLFSSSKVEAPEVQQSRYYQPQDEDLDRISVWQQRITAERPELDLKVISADVNDVAKWQELLKGLSTFVVLLPGPLLFYPWLDRINEAAFGLRIPWTTVALLDGDSAQVGPTIRPGVTACLCFSR